MFRRVLLTALVAATAALGLGPVAPVDAAPQFADPAEATIHPGVQTITDGAQCTANFVFTRGHEVFIGQAAHCSGLGAATDTNGCDSGSLPLGTPVEIQGATHSGTLVYNSWLTMQAENENDPNACAYNDFALVRVHPDDHDLVSPEVPAFGGPTGVGGATAAGDQVFTYGNSSLRLGLAPLGPKTGVSLGTSGGGWTHTVYTVTPGIPGDSGSGVMNADGEAIGVLSTVALAPLTGSNGVSDLGMALDYANDEGAMGVSLATAGSFAGTGGVLGGLLGG